MHCSLCRVNFGISHAGRNDVTSYLKSKKHSNLAKSVSSKATLFHHQSSITDISIEAEVRWATFIAKHNIAFLASDHVTSPFSKIFPDSKITEKFACLCSNKSTAIIKNATCSHFHRRVVDTLSSTPFSLLIDESNDKTAKSCIILARFLDPSVGEVRTRSTDKPVVNTGTTSNFFDALQQALAANGLSFHTAIAFMSDTTNVMKGAESGVQKIKPTIV